MPLTGIEKQIYNLCRENGELMRRLDKMTAKLAEIAEIDHSYRAARLAREALQR